MSLKKPSLNDLGKWVQETTLSQKLYQNSFIVRTRKKMIPLAVKNIACILLDHEVVYAHEFNGDRSAIFKTINKIENAVSPKIFFRINRQMIINRQAIKDIAPFFNRKVIVNLTIPVIKTPIVSRLKVTHFLEWVENPK